MKALATMGQALADLSGMAGRFGGVMRVLRHTLEPAVTEVERMAEAAVRSIDGYAARIDGAAARVAMAADDMARKLADAAATNYADAPGGSGHVEAPPMGVPLSHAARQDNGRHGYTLNGIDGHGEDRWEDDGGRAAKEYDGDTLAAWGEDDEVIMADPFMPQPTRPRPELAAAMLKSEVVHSNGHGTYTVTPLPQRPASVEDAEARNAAALAKADAEAALIVSRRAEKGDPGVRPDEEEAMIREGYRAGEVTRAAMEAHGMGADADLIDDARLAAAAARPLAHPVPVWADDSDPHKALAEVMEGTEPLTPPAEEAIDLTPPPCTVCGGHGHTGTGFLTDIEPCAYCSGTGLPTLAASHGLPVAPSEPAASVAISAETARAADAKGGKRGKKKK